MVPPPANSPNKDENSKLDTEIHGFRESIKRLSAAEIDRDISEAMMNIAFIEEQVKCETERCDPDVSQEIEAKILIMKRKLEMLRDENASRMKDEHDEQI